MREPSRFPPGTPPSLDGMQEPDRVLPRTPSSPDGMREPSRFPPGTPPSFDGMQEPTRVLPGTQSSPDGMRNPARVLLITPPGSYRVHAYLEAARDLGLDMLVASEGEHSLVPGLDGGIRVDLADSGAVIEQALAAHRGRPIAAVVATDDATVEIANRAAAALGLAHNAPTAARTTRRKDLARAALAAAGLPAPAVRRVDLRRPLGPQLAGVEFPCVVKPLAMSASRGVIRADDLAGLEAACRRAGAIVVVATAGVSAGVTTGATVGDSVGVPTGATAGDSAGVTTGATVGDSVGVPTGATAGIAVGTAATATGATASIDAGAEERHMLLVESFVPGPEIALEGMLAGGELSVLAIFDKPDPLDGPFFEETIYVTPSRLPDSVQTLAAERVREGCAAYGLTEGPVHAELRIHDGEAWIIEIAGRTIGGDCARLFTFGSGTSLEHLVLQRALGRAPDGPFRGEARAAGVLMIPTPGAGTLRRVEGVMAASRIPGIREVSITMREGYELSPLPEGGTYLGFVFALGDDPAGVEASLRSAQDAIRVIVAPSLAVEVVS